MFYFFIFGVLILLAFASCIQICSLNYFTNCIFCHFTTEQQAVIEKFNLCEDNLSGLLKWIGQIEQKIASVGGPKEYIDELRNQINLLKVSQLNTVIGHTSIFRSQHDE